MFFNYQPYFLSNPHFHFVHLLIEHQDVFEFHQAFPSVVGGL